MLNQKELQRKNQVDWVNYAKGIAIILIVYRHTLTGLESAGLIVDKVLVLINDLVLSFRMPLFMLLSGIFFSVSFKKRSYLTFTKNKIATILYPYLLWASIQLGVQILLSNFTNHKRGLDDFLNLISSPRELDQFWFLYALFFISVIHATLVYLFRLDKLYYVFLGLVMYMLHPLFLDIDFLFLFFHFYIFYVIGDYFSEILLNPNNTRNLGSLKLLLLLTPFFILLQWVWYNNTAYLNTFYILLIGLAGSIYIICFSNFLALKKKIKVLSFIGKHSMPIYLIHVLVIAAIRIFMVKLFDITNSYLLLFISILGGIVLPILFFILTKNKFWWLYSIENKKS